MADHRPGVNPADPKPATSATTLLPPGALEVYATHPTTGERLGAAVHCKTVGADGVWARSRPRPARPTSSW